MPNKFYAFVLLTVLVSGLGLSYWYWMGNYDGVNATEATFFRYWLDSPQLAEQLLKVTRSLDYTIDFLDQLKRENLEFMKWLGNENPYIYSWLKDGELDEYEKDVLLNATGLGELAPYLMRMPEVYTKEAELTDVLNYLAAIQLIKAEDSDAARFVLETGLFMEDKMFSDLERNFIVSSLDRSDLLRLYTSKFVLDGVKQEDFDILKDFAPSLSQPLSYLTDDLYDLPEIKDGISTYEAEAIQQTSSIVNASQMDYQIRKGICLIDEYGVPDRGLFSFKVPTHNTELQVLLWLAQDMTILGEYYRIALACGLDYGSVVTIGDDEVDAAVRDYVSQRFDYIIETDRVIKQYGVDWQAKDYPLEVDIGLVWGAPGTFYPVFKGMIKIQEYWMHYLNRLFKRPMENWEFKHLFTKTDTLKEMRNWTISNFLGSYRPPEVNVNYPEFQNTYKFCYTTKVDRISADLNDYILIWDSKHFDARDSYNPQYVEVEGKLVTDTDILNTEWQWRRLQEKGSIVGHCVDNAHMHSEMLKSVNIAGFIGYHGDCERGHASPVYYSPQRDVWEANIYEAFLKEGSYKKPPFKYGFFPAPWFNWHIYQQPRRDIRYWRAFYISFDRSIHVKGLPLGYMFRGGSGVEGM